MQMRAEGRKVNVTFQKDYQNLAVHRMKGTHLELPEVVPLARILQQRLQREQKDVEKSVHVDADDHTRQEPVTREVHSVVPIVVVSTVVAVVMVHSVMHDDASPLQQLTAVVAVKRIPKMNRIQLLQQRLRPPQRTWTSFLLLMLDQEKDFETGGENYYSWARQQLKLKWQDIHGLHVHCEDDSLMRKLNGDGAIDVHDDWKKQKEIH